MCEYLKKIAASVIVAVGAWNVAAEPKPMVHAHLIYEAQSLDGAWEMAYRPYECDRHVRVQPFFSGKVVEKAVPGYWEDMVADFRAAGITDDFRTNPLHETQTFPIVGCAQDMTLPNIYGCFFYRRKVTLPHGGAAVLAFEGVRNQVHVWINGRFVAFRQGFSTPFELTVSDGVLRSGENEIVLAVSNNPNLGYCDTASGLTTRAVFGATGGVNGHLELRFPKSDLADVYVTTSADLGACTVHVTGRECFSYEIADGERVVRKGTGCGDFTFATEGLDRWSPESPKLYDLRLRTAAGACVQRFGVRRLVADGERYRLNGRPVYLRGVTEHCYFPQTVHLPRDKAYYRMITAKRKELGFNFVRFHTFVPPVEYLEATDELGMLVHIESPNHVTRQEYAAIVAFARTHPSVVIYCAGNEVRIDRITEAHLESLAELVHSSTDALFTPLSALRGLEYCLSRKGDVIVPEPFEHNPERIARLAKYSDLWTSYQLGATSYDYLNKESAKTVDAWGDVYCGKPRNAHEICIDGSYVDLSTEALYPPDSPILKTGMFAGLREYFRRRGILEKADLYYKKSCEWMRTVRKYAFEKVRASDRIAGFDFLGDINTHWHTFGYSVGMMDEFYRLKPGETVENVLRYNSAAVLLTDLDSDFNVTAGMEKSIAFSLSNYEADAPSARLTADLVDAKTGESVATASASWPGTMIPNGCVSPLRTLTFQIPASSVPRKYVLRAMFTGGVVTACNEWELYAFPKTAPAPAPANVRVVTDLSKDEMMTAMARGERVLLLGAGPFKTHPLSYRIGLAGRCAGNYATVLKSEHPLFKDLPNDGWCGWQFRRLMEGAASVQLEAGVPFDPVIDVASSVKCVIRQSPLFEYRVGEGRLLVCTFRFVPGDPAGAWLKNRLYAYAGSDAFEPASRLTPEELSTLIDAPRVSCEANRNAAHNLNDAASSVRDGQAVQE